MEHLEQEMKIRLFKLEEKRLELEKLKANERLTEKLVGFVMSIFSQV